MSLDPFYEGVTVVDFVTVIMCVVFLVLIADLVSDIVKHWLD